MDIQRQKRMMLIFDVITDDGWSFKCKVSGDYSKISDQKAI